VDVVPHQRAPNVTALDGLLRIGERLDGRVEAELLDGAARGMSTPTSGWRMKKAVPRGSVAGDGIIRRRASALL